MIMVNLLDAYYGLYANFKKKSRWDKGNMFIKSLMYEFYYTKGVYTSSKDWVESWDNYFHNGVYRSGWTYNNNVIGLPFFSTNFDGKVDENRLIDNIRILVHHLGFQGWFNDNIPYKMLLSYRKNYGVNLYNSIPKNIFSSLLDVNLGAGIKLNKQF